MDCSNFVYLCVCSGSDFSKLGGNKARMEHRPVMGARKHPSGVTVLEHFFLVRGTVLSADLSSSVDTPTPHTSRGLWRLNSQSLCLQHLTFDCGRDLAFCPRDAMLARVIAIATCLSVCHAPVLCQNKES